MENKSKKIMSEISIGELLDKISILEIKVQKITNKDDLKEVNKEYEILKKIQESSIKIEGEIEKLFNAIKSVNLSLWNVEDELRILEKNQDFGKNFIKLAREVYFNNDKRSKIKSQINKMSGSNIREVKQYVDY
jgi:adenine C2-methylase RlmN of 23S rRNA A2503 and tRNA A37